MRENALSHRWPMPLLVALGVISLSAIALALVVVVTPYRRVSRNPAGGLVGRLAKWPVPTSGLIHSIPLPSVNRHDGEV